MKRLNRMGINSIVISATLANSGINGVGVCRADPPQAVGAKAAAPKKPTVAQQQQAKKQQVKAARAIRQAQRLLDRQNADGEGDGSLGTPFGMGNGFGLGNGGGASPGSVGGVSAANGFFGSSNSAGSSTNSATGLANGGGPANGPGQAGLTFNAKIIEFAIKNLGTQVGNGECWTLAEDALLYAGAKPADQYVFGDAIPLSSIQPGDILQFENAIFIGPLYWMRLGVPHHTAIVDSAQGTQVVILQQNFNGNLKVQMTVINMADLRSGSVTAYRAVPNN